MAGARKLQAEVDRTLKRIEEGLEVFDGLHGKLEAADAPAHKARLEDELKRELKKLQKFRDSVKTWAAGNEIKTKGPLLEARHKVEERMEIFKARRRARRTGGRARGAGRLPRGRGGGRTRGRVQAAAAAASGSIGV
jgi:CCR4-NOT transcription complex subunit 3